MLELALWLKKNGYRADQVQAFLPSPMSSATAMYHTGKNPLRPVKRNSEAVSSPKSAEQRRLHKAFLRYHDPKNWQLLREALRRLGRQDLIGSQAHQLVPVRDPVGTNERSPHAGRKPRLAGRAATQHTGLPDFRPRKR